MKNRMKRAVAFLITIMLAVNILPVSAPADVGEHGPFRLSKAGTWITLRLGKKDVMSYEEILGDLYTSTLDIRAYNIDNNYQDVSGANVQADWNSKKVRNLFTMPFDRPLKWSVDLLMLGAVVVGSGGDELVESRALPLVCDKGVGRADCH